MLQKPKRKQNRDLLDTYHGMRCAACGSSPCDPAHIRSKGAGGHDERDNLVPLCRRCHSMSHQIGWAKMLHKYSTLSIFMHELGWRINEHNRLERFADTTVGE